MTAYLQDPFAKSNTTEGAGSESTYLTDPYSSIRSLSDAASVSRKAHIRQGEERKAAQEAQAKADAEQAKLAEVKRVKQEEENSILGQIKSGLSSISNSDPMLRQMRGDTSVVSGMDGVATPTNTDRASHAAIAELLPTVAAEDAANKADFSVGGAPVRAGVVASRADTLANEPVDMQQAAIAQDGVEGRINQAALAAGDPNVVAPAIKQAMAADDQQILANNDAKTANALREQTYGAAVQSGETVAEDPGMTIKSEGERFRESHPLASGVISGTAGLVQGGLDFIPLAADALNQVINPYIELLGGSALGQAPRVVGAKELQEVAGSFKPEIANKKWSELKGADQTTDWIAAQLAIQSPQLVGATGAALLSKVRGLYLGTMGAMSAGGTYQQDKENGVDTSAAIADSFVNGGIEILTEMLPFGVFDKVKKVLPGLPKAAQASLIGTILNKSGVVATALASTMGAGAIEEIVANTGQNASSKYIAGNTAISDITEGNTEAGIIGALMGGPVGGAAVYQGLKEAGPVAPPTIQAFNQLIDQGSHTNLTDANLQKARDISLRYNTSGAAADTIAAFDAELFRRQNLGTLERAAEVVTRDAHPINQLIGQPPAPAGVLSNASANAPDMPAPVEPVDQEAPIGMADVKSDTILAMDDEAINHWAVNGTSEDIIKTLSGIKDEAVRKATVDRLGLSPRATEMLHDDLGHNEVKPATFQDIHAEDMALLDELNAQDSVQSPMDSVQSPNGQTTQTSLRDLDPAEDYAGYIQAIDTRLARSQERTLAETGQSAFRVNPVSAEEATAINPLVEAVRETFGSTVVPFSATEADAPDGFALDGKAHVNVSNLDKAVAFVIAHEFGHTMEQSPDQEDRNTAQWLRENLMPLISVEGQRAYAEQFLTKGMGAVGKDGKRGSLTLEQVNADPELRRLLESEMVQDFLGKRMTDRKFLNDLAKRDPTGFVDFAKKWIGALDKMIASLKGKKKDLGVQDIDKYIKELTKAKNLASTAMIQWRAQAKAREAQAAEQQDDEAMNDEQPQENPVDDDGVVGEIQFAKKNTHGPMGVPATGLTSDPALNLPVSIPVASSQPDVIKKLDALAVKHPNPFSNEAAWQAFMADATGVTSEAYMTPAHAIEWANHPDNIAAYVNKMTPGQRLSADEGLALAGEIGEDFKSGTLDVVDFGNMLSWVSLSKMLTASVHEAGFLRLQNSRVLRGFISKVAEGTWSEADAEAGLAEVERLFQVGGGLPSGAKANARALFTTTFPKIAAARLNGKPLLAEIHRMLVEGASSSEIRRAYMFNAKGAGIQTKVFSFAMLMAGRPDVVVVDRWQVRNFWDSKAVRDHAPVTYVKDGKTKTSSYWDALYDGLPVGVNKDGDTTFTGISANLDGPLGLAIYEAFERSLALPAGKVYNGKGGVGRLHWESWLVANNQEVGHASLDALRDRDAEGATVVEGRSIYSLGDVFVYENGQEIYYVDNGQGQFARFSQEEYAALPNKNDKGQRRGAVQAVIDATGAYGSPASRANQREVNGVTFEAAPNPNDVELTAAWNKLSPEAKLKASIEIAKAIVPKALKALGIRGKSEAQQGGYLDNTNPSFKLSIPSWVPMAKVLEVSKLLGYVLKQEGMMVVGLKPFDGAKTSGVINFEVPEGMELHDAYMKVREASGGRIGGHSTVGRQMAIVVEAEQVDELANLVDATLNVTSDFRRNAQVAYLQEYGYGDRQDGTTVRAGSSVLRGVADNLRSETTRLIAEASGYTGPSFSRKGLDQGRSERAAGSTARTGEGSVSVNGTHYSNQERQNLDGRYYGTGIKGAEQTRVLEAKDRRLRSRLYFYVDEGKGVKPEAGVGKIAHNVDVTNLYNTSTRTLSWEKDPYGDNAVTMNNFESAVLDAGYNGYYRPGAFGDQGVAILLGDAAVNVKPSFSRKQTETPEFKKWFGDSKVVDAEGKPLVVYHGTKDSISIFNGGDSGINWFSTSLNHAKVYADSKPQDDVKTKAKSNLLKVYLSIKNPLDLSKVFYEYEGLANEESLLDFLIMSGLQPKEGTDEYYAQLGRISMGGLNLNDTNEIWQWLRDSTVLSEIKKAGYDGVIQYELYGDSTVKTFGAFNPTQIKSATGNNGNFDANNNDIRFSRKEVSQLVFINETAKNKKTWGKHITVDQIKRVDQESDEGFKAKNAGMQLNAAYIEAAKQKEAYDGYIKAVAEKLGLVSSIPGLKKRKRTVEKIIADYGNDVGKMKDMLRSTIETESLTQARELYEALREIVPLANVSGNDKSYLDPSKPPLGDSGYRDAKLIIDVNGVPAELIIAPAALLRAKDIAHSMYDEQRELIAKSGTVSVEQSNKMAVRIAELNDKMAEIYAPAVERSQSSSASLRVHGTELSRELKELQSLLSGSNANLGGNLSSSERGISATGMPSKSKNLVPSGKSESGVLGSDISSTSNTDSIPQGNDGVQLSRKDMNFKDVVKRDPVLEKAAIDLKDGKISEADYRKLVLERKPVEPFDQAPVPATLDQMGKALTSDKVGRIGAARKLEAGHPVGLRLDIPAYSNHGTWVVAVHEQESGFNAGKSIGYDSAAAVTDVTFGVVEKAALNIAAGKPKATIAVVKGSWKPITPAEAKRQADAAISDPAWVQVGMDPTRHAYFYDRTNTEPVVSASEVIQVGPLVLAKNPVYGNRGDFKFSRKQFEPTKHEGFTKALDKAAEAVKATDERQRREAIANIIPVAETPPAFKLVKALRKNDFVIGSAGTIYLKGTNQHANSSHNAEITVDVLAHLPELMADPVAIYDKGAFDKSNPKANSTEAMFLVVLPIKVKGEYVTVAIAPESRFGKATVNFIKSIHTRAPKTLNLYAKHMVYEGISGRNEEDLRMMLGTMPRVLKSGIQPVGGMDLTIRSSKGIDKVKSRNDVPKFSRKQSADPVPEETTAEAVQRTMQDKFNRFKVLQNWLKDKGVQLTEAADVYLAETLMSGRTATRKEDFRDKVMAPLIKKTQKAGIKMEEIADFLKMQHAQEANAQARKIQGKPDATAYGVSDADAKKALADYATRSDFNDLKAIANEWRGITSQTRDILLNGGIISKEMADAWDATYSMYVPVKGTDDEAAAKTGTGKGLNVNGKTKQRLGHELRDEAIIENILRDHEKAIALDEKNRVGKALIKFALEAQNEDIITVGKPVQRKVLKQGQTAFIVTYHGSDVASFDSLGDAQDYVRQAVLKAGGKGSGTQNGFTVVKTADPVRVMLQASPMLAENEVNVYVAGHAVRIQINDDIAAREYTNMGVEHLHVIMAAGREMNNWLSKVYTGYSPDFILTNPIRDAIQGSITLTGEHGAKTAAEIFTNYPLAMKELAKFYATGNSQLVRDYRANGGSTGGAYLSDLERIGNDIQAAYDEHLGVMKTYKAAYDKAIANGKSPKAAHAMAILRSGVAGFKKVPVLGHFARLMERLNALTENALRVATFHTLVKNGMSKPRAAAQAKNLMNFNRKGEQSNAIGALYLFYNPSVQGSALIKQTLTNSPHKLQAQALAGTMVLGAMAVAALAMSGDDDDKRKWESTPDHVKDGNIVINVGGKQITITLPYGYRMFWTLGNILHDAQQPGADFNKLGIRMASSVFQNLSPFGNPLESKDHPVAAVLPTVGRMVMGPENNENSFGSPIAPPKYNETKPDSQNMNRATHGTLYASVAEKLNTLTGGSAYEKGAVDVSPEVLKFWVRSLTGGTGQFVIDMTNLVIGAAQGVGPQDYKDIPVARRFVREPGVSDARQAYWDRANEAKEAAGQVALARKARDVNGFNDLSDRKGELARMAKLSDRMIKQANAKRDAVDAIRLDKTLSLADKQAKMKAIEAEETAIYEKFIKAYDADIKMK